MIILRQVPVLFLFFLITLHYWAKQGTSTFAAYLGVVDFRAYLARNSVDSNQNPHPQQELPPDRQAPHELPKLQTFEPTRGGEQAPTRQHPVDPHRRGDLRWVSQMSLFPSYKTTGKSIDSVSFAVVRSPSNCLPKLGGASAAVSLI